MLAFSEGSFLHAVHYTLMSRIFCGFEIVAQFDWMWFNFEIEAILWRGSFWFRRKCFLWATTAHTLSEIEVRTRTCWFEKNLYQENWSPSDFSFTHPSFWLYNSYCFKSWKLVHYCFVHSSYWLLGFQRRRSTVVSPIKDKYKSVHSNEIKTI